MTHKHTNRIMPMPRLTCAMPEIMACSRSPFVLFPHTDRAHLIE